jgi:hemerythrin superfamily protein
MSDGPGDDEMAKDKMTDTEQGWERIRTVPIRPNARIVKENSMPQTERKSTRNDETDAITLLTADHRDVEKMFKEFEKARKAEDTSAKAEVVQLVCAALTAHAEIEEEVFYPAVRKVIEDEDVMDEAEVEHGAIKRLVEELKEMVPDDGLYDAKVTVLTEYVKHHVKEEEGEMFPKVKKSGVDLKALGTEMMERKKEIEATLDAA